MFTSEKLLEGNIYARKDLRELFNIHDATINTGVFQPVGYQSIWLFITENKAKDYTPYKDQLHENTLYWDGQTEGRTDTLIINHETKGLEVLVFYRLNKRAFLNGGFKYEGRFRYVSHEGAQPTHFILQRTINTLSPSENTVEDRIFLRANDKNLYKLKEEKLNKLLKEERSLRIVYCYAHEDKALRDELDKHLSVLKRLYQIISWHDHKITPGTEWEKEIDVQLNTANIILLLVSADFMASEYCYGIEMRRALERHERGEAKVIPIILRPIGWEDSPIGKLKVLPTDGTPIVDRSWYTLDHALQDVVKNLKEVIVQLDLYKN